MNRHKIFKHIAAGTAALACTVYAAGFLHKIAAARQTPRLKMLKRMEKEFFNESVCPDENIFSAGKWLAEEKHEEITITSFDGLKLKGHLYLSDNPKRTLIMFHGFRSSWQRDFGCAAGELCAAGCNLLIVEQRAHGTSEGKYITYGILERFDCRDWANYAAKRFPNHPLYLDGISMGASTVLMASVLDLPPTVKGIIADCGYTSPLAIIKKVFRQKSPLPLPGVVKAVSIFNQFAAGCSFDDFSTIDAMRNNTHPVFFAHGDADKFVPLEMTLENYLACTAPKTLLIAHGAAHGTSYLVAHDSYYNSLMNFFAKYDR